MARKKKNLVCKACGAVYEGNKGDPCPACSEDNSEAVPELPMEAIDEPAPAKQPRKVPERPKFKDDEIPKIVDGQYVDHLKRKARRGKA